MVVWKALSNVEAAPHATNSGKTAQLYGFARVFLSRVGPTGLARFVHCPRAGDGNEAQRFSGGAACPCVRTRWHGCVA